MFLCAPNAEQTRIGVDPRQTSTTDCVNLEVTSRCNLRCLYCAASQPEYVGSDLAPDLAHDIFTDLKTRQLKMLCLNGHGETTIVKNWHKKYQTYIDTFPMSITSNFSRVFTSQETDVLSGFETINISLDTADAELLQQVRRNVKLHDIIKNIKNIQNVALQQNRPGPKIYIFCTLYDKNVFLLENLARMVVNLKLAGVMFGQLIKHPDLENALNVNIITALPKSEQKRALQVIDRACHILRENDVEVGFWGNHIEVLRQQLSGDEPSDGQAAKALAKKIDQKNKKRQLGNLDWQESVIDLCEDGQTRDCLDPWITATIDASGHVIPCCIGQPAGTVTPTKSLNHVLNNRSMKNLRRNLLLGQLDADCAVCPVRLPISIEAFRRNYMKKVIMDRQIQTSPRHSIGCRIARRILEKRLPNSFWAKKLYRSIRKMVSLKCITKFADKFYNPIHPALRKQIRVVHVKENQFFLSDRIFLHPNHPQHPAATIQFLQLLLADATGCDLYLYLDNDQSQAVEFEVLITNRRGETVCHEYKTINQAIEHWPISFSPLNGQYTLTIRSQMAKDVQTNAYAWAFISYPLFTCQQENE